jgi:hypothetical protein
MARCSAFRKGLQIQFWSCFRFLWFKVQWLTGAEPCFDVTRPAKFSACDGDGQGKQGEQGKGKE